MIPFARQVSGSSCVSQTHLVQVSFDTFDGWNNCSQKRIWFNVVQLFLQQIRSVIAQTNQRRHRGATGAFGQFIVTEPSLGYRLRQSESVMGPAACRGQHCMRLPVSVWQNLRGHSGMGNGWVPKLKLQRTFQFNSIQFYLGNVYHTIAHVMMNI